MGNGINNYLLDTLNYIGRRLDINTNPRNGRPAFNTSAITPEGLGPNGQSVLGVLGNASRRLFYGPGISNFDTTLAKRLALTESKSFEFRLEAFNIANHTQFRICTVLRARSSGRRSERGQFRTNRQRCRSAPGPARHEIRFLRWTSVSRSHSWFAIRCNLPRFV